MKVDQKNSKSGLSKSSKVIFDDKKIQRLYESIRKSDYFLIDGKDFDWNEFNKIDEGFLDLSTLDLHGYLLESFEKIQTNSNNDTYEIKLHNGLLFFVTITYVEGKKARELFDKKRMEALLSRDLELAQNYKEKLSTIKDGEEACVVVFKDQKGRIDRTGEVNLSSKELFITLKNALIDSWASRKALPSEIVVLRVAKNDPKRLDFYKFLFSKFLPHSDMLVDSVTEAEYSILYAIRKQTA
jgi:hypothetical protein